MKRIFLKKIIAACLGAALAFSSVPFIPATGRAAFAADSKGTVEGTVTVKYTVQVNQSTSIIQPILDKINEERNKPDSSNGRPNDSKIASEAVTSTGSSLTYNSELENYAIDRAEDIALIDKGDGTRPNGTAQESLVPSGTNFSKIITYSGESGSSPADEWAKNKDITDKTNQSAAIGHVTYNDKEYYCIILSTKPGTGSIGYDKTNFISPVSRDLTYSNIGSIYVSYSDNGTNFYDPIAFKDGNGSSTADIKKGIEVEYGKSASLPKQIKYQVSTASSKSGSGSSGSQVYDLDSSSITSSSTYVSDTSGIGLSGNTVTGKKVGSYTVTYEAQIAGKRTLFNVPVTVSTADLSGATVTYDGKDYYANGTASEPGVTVKLNGTTLTKDTDYTVAYSDNNPDTSSTTDQTGTITVTGKGNYTGTATGTFPIHPANGGGLSSATIAVTEKNITYDGKEKKPKITVTLQGVTIPESSYSVKYANNVNAGTANIIVTAKNGDQRYTGVAKGSFTISPADLASADFTFSDADNKSKTNAQYTYTGAEITPEPEIKVGSETLTKGTDFTYSYSNNKAIGTTATVTITGKGNYTGTAFSYFQITQGNLSKATVTPTPAEFTYNGQKQYPAVVVVAIGKHQLVQGVDYTISAFPDSVDAGTYSFTITGINNFKGTGISTSTSANGSTSNSTSSNGTASNSTSTTGTTQTSTSITGTSTSTSNNGSTSNTSGTSTSNSTENTGVLTSSYTISAKDAESLYGQDNGITVTGVSKQTYTGKEIVPTISVVDNVLGKVLDASTDYTRTDSDNKDPGTAGISLEFKGNYTGTISLSYKIVPKKTTLKKVTAGKKKATVTYKKISGITGYQVKCGTNKAVTKSTKTKNTTKTKYTMTSLKKGKRYYFKIRTYFTTASGSKVYSSWSNVKSAKVK